MIGVCGVVVVLQAPLVDNYAQDCVHTCGQANDGLVCSGHGVCTVPHYSGTYPAVSICECEEGFYGSTCAFTLTQVRAALHPADLGT